MDEMKLVEHVFAEPKPDPDVTAAGRARLLELAGGVERPPVSRRPRTRTRWLLGAGLLPVAAAGTAIALLAGHSPGPASPPSDRDARKVLLAAAVRTAEATATGRYFRFVVEEGKQFTVGSKDHPYNVVQRVVIGSWYAATPGPADWSTRQDIGGQPLTPADAAAYRAAGSPARVETVCRQGRPIHPKFEQGPDGKLLPPTTLQPSPPPGPSAPPCWVVNMRPVPGSSMPMPGGTGGEGVYGQAPGGLHIAKLSDDPATLRAQLLAWTRSDGLMGPVEGDSAQLWVAAGLLVSEPIGPVPPKLRAAAYRVLAALPDVRSLGTVTDQRGRRGVALTRTSHGSEGIGPGNNRLVIDPRTGAPLERSSIGTDSREYQLVLDYGYTNDSPPPARR